MINIIDTKILENGIHKKMVIHRSLNPGNSLGQVFFKTAAKIVEG
jgi:hypothetical protein